MQSVCLGRKPLRDSENSAKNCAYEAASARQSPATPFCVSSCKNDGIIGIYAMEKYFAKRRTRTETVKAPPPSDRTSKKSDFQPCRDLNAAQNGDCKKRSPPSARERGESGAIEKANTCYATPPFTVFSVVSAFPSAVSFLS